MHSLAFNRHVGSLFALLTCMIFSLVVGNTVYSKPKKKRKKQVAKLEAAPPVLPKRLTPLSATQQAGLAAIRVDPEPESIVRNSHYWVSNEHNHQLWKSYIQGIGGALIGVGTDQNYLLAGWMKPSLLLLMDFDGEIPKLHEIYKFFFEISDTPERFISRWERKYADDSIEKLTAYFSSKSNGENQRWVKRRVKMYKVTRGLLYRRLKKTLKKYRSLNIKTFLDDPEQYQYLRELWATGRVRALRGDLTANDTTVSYTHLTLPTNREV